MLLLCPFTIVLVHFPCLLPCSQWLGTQDLVFFRLLLPLCRLSRRHHFGIPSKLVPGTGTSLALPYLHFCLQTIFLCHPLLLFLLQAVLCCYLTILFTLLSAQAIKPTKASQWFHLSRSAGTRNTDYRPR